jgi:hypothetical protein
MKSTGTNHYGLLHVFSAGDGGGGLDASTLVLYPMKCPNRQAERRPELLDVLRAKGYSREVDLSWGEQQGMFFEGTGERGSEFRV